MCLFSGHERRWRRHRGLWRDRGVGWGGGGGWCEIVCNKKLIPLMEHLAVWLLLITLFVASDLQPNITQRPPGQKSSSYIYIYKHICYKEHVRHIHYIIILTYYITVCTYLYNQPTEPYHYAFGTFIFLLAFLSTCIGPRSVSITIDLREVVK